MPSFSTQLAEERAEVVLTRLNGGEIELLDADSNVIASINIGASGLSRTGLVISGSNFSGTGTAAAGTGTDAVTGRVVGDAGFSMDALTVGNSGAHINLNNVNIANGQEVNIATLEFTDEDAIEVDAS